MQATVTAVGVVLGHLTGFIARHFSKRFLATMMLLLHFTVMLSIYINAYSRSVLTPKSQAFSFLKPLLAYGEVAMPRFGFALSVAALQEPRELVTFLLAFSFGCNTQFAISHNEAAFIISSYLHGSLLAIAQTGIWGKDGQGAPHGALHGAVATILVVIAVIVAACSAYTRMYKMALLVCSCAVLVSVANYASSVTHGKPNQWAPQTDEFLWHDLFYIGEWATAIITPVAVYYLATHPTKRDHD